MKVHQIQQTRIEKQEPQFKGAGDAFLRYLATNQAVGANGVDLAFMVLPRTGTDLVKRGPAAGLETGRREASGTANHTLIGVYGLGSGLLAASLMGIDKAFGTDVNKIFAAPETINILAENKANQIKNGKQQLDYLKETLSNVKAFNPTAKGADAEGFIKLLPETVEEIANIMDEVLANESMDFKTWKDVKTANSIEVVINKITEKTGAQAKYILESADGEIKSNTELRTLLEDLFKVSKSFNKEKVTEAFVEQVRDNKTIKDNTFVSKLTKFMKTRAGAGFAVATAIGMSIQPLNIYLTKKKTGSDGFVGVEGRSKDNSTGFKLMKGAAGAGFFGLTLATLGTGLRGFMDKMAFKGFWPTINQLKGVYGLTIVSRLLATRDKDELRESLTKDTLGFLSWLVLGDIVNKIAANALDKPEATVLNTTEKEAKGLWAKTKRVFNATLKTRDEILIESLAAKDIKSTKIENGKVIAKTFKEMMEDLNKIADKDFVATAKRRLGTLNKAQLAGYLFSGLVLGLGIPNLNIYITNKLDQKRKAQLAEQEAQKQMALA
jgi:ribosomal protein L17